MSVRSVLRMGDPRLLQVCEPVAAFNTPELHTLVRDMFDTMREQRGAGLAAIQIGVALRVVIFGFDSDTRSDDCESVPETILINPQIEPLATHQELAWEGCLSVPGMRGLVPRYSHVRYRGFDVRGGVIERQVRGFHARVVQHECDHLDGILYPRRLPDLTYFGFVEELDAGGVMTAGVLPCEDDRCQPTRADPLR